MIRFSYQAIHGGGFATIADREREVKLFVSDVLGDPLSELAWALIGLLRGADQVTARWLDEPGERRLIFDRIDDQLQLRIIHFDDWSQRPDESGEEVFAIECRLVDFTGQVLSEMRRIRNEHGAEGSEELRPRRRYFPLAEYETLRRLQRERKRAKRTLRST